MKATWHPMTSAPTRTLFKNNRVESFPRTTCSDADSPHPQLLQQHDLFLKRQGRELRAVGSLAFNEAGDPITHGSSGLRKRFPKLSHLSSKW